jgi:hypothetical protein
MASFKVAFKQGFNLISIPLDMTGASYQDDPRELFPAYLRTSYIPNQGFEGEYMFERISNGIDSYINQDGEWKFVGESGSEWTSITTSQALSVFVNVPPNTTMVKKTFNGDTISSPNTIQYNLVEGWNIVSYPYEIDQDFGQGSYSTSAATLDVIIDFCLNNNYLKGSGHSDACITKVISKKGEITNPKFSFGLNYDGSGSDSSDWSKPDDLQELEKFLAGSAVILFSDSDKTGITLWSNTSQNNNDNYNFLQGTTGITTAQTDGNRGMNTFTNGSNGGYNPFYSKHRLFAKFLIIQSDSAQSGDLSNFKIKDSSGNNIFVLRKKSNGRFEVEGSSTEYIIGFFVERLFNLDSNKPNWGNRGYINGFGDNYNQSNTATSISNFGMEHTSIGSLLSTYPTTITGVPDNDAPMRFAKAPSAGPMTFAYFNGFQSISGQPYLSIKMDSYYFGINEFSSSQERDLATGFIPGDYIVPIIYDPTATDGQRYRFCKYYPHKDDMKAHTFDFPDIHYQRDIPEYHDIFYDEDGNFKFDPVLGDPYIEPVYKRFPYKIIDPQTIRSNFKHYQGRISGIFQML